MFSFGAMPPVGHWAMLPASFVNAVQLRHRLTLAPLAGNCQALPQCHASAAAPWTPRALVPVAMFYHVPPACVTAPLAMALT